MIVSLIISDKKRLSLREYNQKVMWSRGVDFDLK